MSAGKGVVFTLQWSRERTDAVKLSVGTEHLTSSCQNLMSVCLVAHIPNDSVVRGVIYVVECHCDFNHAKRGGKMTRVDGNLVDDVFSQFFAYLWQLVDAQFAQILRVFDVT